MKLLQNIIQSVLLPFLVPVVMKVYHTYDLVLSKVERSGALLKTLRRTRCRGHIVQTAVRAVVIIIHPPTIANISQFINIQKQFPVQ